MAEPKESPTGQEVASTKLFGLEQQQQQLNDAFQRCVNTNKEHSQQPELSIIFGSSGSGKTALTQTLQTHAKFLALGKCDQFQQGSEPFGPFVVAFSKLADEILRKDEETSQQFKSKAQKSIHNETEIQILTDLVPDLVDFFPNANIKNQNKDATANAIQRSDRTENPTIQVVCKFLKSICSADHPIVLIVDDIQWIDSSSLELLESLSKQQNIAGLMLVATCRDDEITPDHSVSETIRNLQDNNDVSMTKIHVGALSIETVSELVVDRFPTLAGRNLESLCTVLHAHTKGNAFFAVQLLQRLKKSGWKAPKQAAGEGEEEEEWDSAAALSMANHLTQLDCNSLVDIMMSDTASETPFMEEVLTSASCLGSDFMTSHLTLAVSEETTKFVHEALSVMEQREFIRPRRGGQGWSWAHDKFQKAAYLLMDETDRERFHLTIGRRLLSSLDKDELQQHIFIVVSQFCIAMKYIDEDEKESTATLLLQAGERSALSSSFGKAAAYFSMGLSLLKVENWESQYELSLQLYNSLAAMECCKGNFGESDKLVNVILRHSKSIRDRLRAYEIKLSYLAAKEYNTQAIVLGLDVLEQLGEKFPRNPGRPKIMYEVMSTKWLLSNKSVDDVLKMKPLTDWKKLAMLQISQYLFSPMLRAKPELIPIFACRTIKMTLKYGLSSLSCYTFAMMGSIFCHPVGYLDTGYKCVEICEGIIKKYGIEEFLKCSTGLGVDGYARPFRSPIRELLDPLKETGHLGLVIGDIDVSFFCFVHHSYNMLFCGEPLETTMSVTRDHLKKFLSLGQHHRAVSLAPLQQLMENLVNPTDYPLAFTGKYMEEESWMEKATMANDAARVMTLWLNKAFIAVHLGKHQEAKEFMGNLMKCDVSSFGGAAVIQTYFLDALVDVLSARDEKKNGGGGKARKYQSSLKKLRLYWKNIPSNVANKISLIEAELELLKKRRKFTKDVAVSKFKKSIREAKQEGVIFEEAYAYERCAIAMLEWGDVTEALEYFERAKSLYERWGARVKVLQLIKFVEEKSGVTMKISMVNINGISSEN